MYDDDGGLCAVGVYKSSGVVEIVITTVQLRKIAKVIKSKVFVTRAVTGAYGYTAAAGQQLHKPGDPVGGKGVELLVRKGEGEAHHARHSQFSSRCDTLFMHAHTRVCAYVCACVRR